MSRRIARLIIALIVATPGFAARATILLDGRSLTPAVLARIADGEAIDIAPASLRLAAQSAALLFEAAKGGQPIYGLTVGVGLNKDQKMVDMRGDLTPDILAASRRFNLALLRSHAGAIGPDISVRLARAAMTVRLNSLLAGASGVQPAVIESYRQFLNRGVTPAIPGKGSIGEADITILSHVGLAMLGEGEVYFQGRKIPAKEALAAAGIEPIEPVGKDALAILSSNAYAAGMAALALNDMARLTRLYKLVYAHSLQGFDGNVSPFLEDSLALRGFPDSQRAGAALRELLDGSSLWARSDRRALQDPLSFRDGVYLLGELDRSLAETTRLLILQINASDDNPAVAVGVVPHSGRDQERRGYLDGGALLPTANFEPLPWVLAFEELGLALAHNGLASAQRIIHLNDDHMTGLSRFLGTPATMHAFGSMEKPAMALAEEIRALANPVSLDFLPVAGGIEDIATNAPAVAHRVQQQIDDSFSLLAIEVIHAAQAVDLRQRKDDSFRLSPPSAALQAALRRQVASLDHDRSMSADFRLAEGVLRGFDLGTVPDGAPISR